MAQPQTHGRLDHLDGLRSIAILWVAIYHFAYFWTSAGRGTELLPYDAALAWIPLANVGFLGVYLFFIVSGFVIAMSLQRSESFGRFCINRLIRLSPTLVLCGTLTYIATNLFGPPDLVRSTLEYLISLTFIPPPHVGRLIGVEGLEWLDGAYWSLWTEVRFYLIAACLYFVRPARFLQLWALFALACLALHLLARAQGGAFEALSRLLFTEYQPYFSAGIALAVLRFGGQQRTAWTLLLIAIGQAVVYPILSGNAVSLTLFVGLLIVFALAIPTMLARNHVPFLSSRLMVEMGVASYAYYLLHQNAGIALLTAFATGSIAVDIAIMLCTQTILIILSIWLTRAVEEPIRKRLRQLV